MNKHVKCLKKSHFHILRVWGISVLLLLGLVVQNASAGTQQSGKTITGTVFDELNEPVPGANVVVEGTTNGIMTDMDGKFTLNNVPDNATLLVSYVGYTTRKIKVSGKTNFEVKLAEDTQNLEEVVVIGYGQQKKTTLTGAVASIQTKELKQSSSANLSTALAGRMPGLTTNQTNGQPGADDVMLYLRGQGTTSDATPLILIDGVPRDNISVLDPNEISSISILKDASATAVFGVRGANGVILITTRRGEAGKTELSVTANYGLQGFTTKPDFVHSWDFAELHNQASANSGLKPAYTDYMIEQYKAGGNPFYPDRDIYSEMFKDWTPQSKINANLSGGSERMKYFANVGYTGQGGIFNTVSKEKLGYDPSFKMSRYNFRSNLDLEITKDFKMSLNLASYLEKTNTPCVRPEIGNGTLGDPMTGAINYVYGKLAYTPPTTVGPYTVDGYGSAPGVLVIHPNFDDWDGYSSLNYSGYTSTTTTNLNSSLTFEYNLHAITEGLSTKLMVAYDNKARTQMYANRMYDVDKYSVASSPDEKSYYYAQRENQDETLHLGKVSRSSYLINIQYSINYARRFGLHNVSAMMLAQRDAESRALSGVPNRNLPYNYLGLVGRLTYDYDSRYLADASFGYNGSEQFNKGHRFGFFPSASAGWVISNEGFLKDNSILTNLKLRASYGIVGSDKLGAERFLYISQVSTTTGGPISSLGKHNMVSQGKIGNEDLSWETTKKLNIGIDLQLFKELSFSFDYFDDRCDNNLISRNSIPIMGGISAGNLPKVNMGKTKNKGFEFDVSWNKQLTDDLSFVLKGNMGYAKNTVIENDEVARASDYAYRYRTEGFSKGQWWGYLIDYSNGNGYINTQEELDNLPDYEIGTPRIGDFKYVDLNGDGVINDKDQAPIGYSIVPRINYGFSGSVTYKDFDVAFTFSGIAQSTRSYLYTPTTEDGTNNLGFFNGIHLHAWTAERYANGEKIEYPALGIGSNTSKVGNNFFIMDRSYLRLKNLEIGYTFPRNLLKFAGINAVRVFLNGNNLLVWDHLKQKGQDPEQTGMYPITRTISAGVSVTF